MKMQPAIVQEVKLLFWLCVLRMYLDNLILKGGKLSGNGKGSAYDWLWWFSAPVPGEMSVI